jgi:hypothetical protein
MAKVGDLDRDPIDKASRKIVLPARIGDAVLGKFLEYRGGDVVRHRESEEESISLPLARDIANTARHRAAQAAKFHRRAIEFESPVIEQGETTESLGQFAAARSDEAGERHDFAGMEREACIVRDCLSADFARCENSRAGFCSGPSAGGPNVPANHRAHHVVRLGRA